MMLYILFEVIKSLGILRLATSLFPDNTKLIKLRLKMKNQEGEKLEEEENRLVTLEWS